MKIHNTTTWSSEFLRRMVSWCCREVDYPSTGLCVRFGNSRRQWGGLAYLGRNRIGVRVSQHDADFPCRTRKHFTGAQELIADRVEALVKVTAHEIAHLEAYRRRSRSRRGGGGGGSEQLTDQVAFTVLRKFRRHRGELESWWREPVAERPTKRRTTAQERRAKIAEMRLAEWARRAKLAATKVRKYKRQVAYYQRVAASRGAAVEEGGRAS